MFIRDGRPAGSVRCLPAYRFHRKAYLDRVDLRNYTLVTMTTCHLVPGWIRRLTARYTLTIFSTPGPDRRPG